MNDASDAELVEAVRGGERDAYKHLVTRYQGHVYGLAYSIVGNWVEAQDIAQETFIRAYSNLDQLREPGKFASWLRRVAFSVTMNWLRAFRPGLFRHLDGRVDVDSLEIPDFRPGPSEEAAKRELADAVLAAVAALPPKYRVPLTMFHLDGLSYQKVADFLDIPVGTAKSLVHRAKAKLREAALAGGAGEMDPMVAEVFNEHKLPEEFASRVLEGIGELNYGKSGQCTWCGSVVKLMEYLGDPVDYDYVMGVSGSAFMLLWHMSWCPSNNTLMVLGPEPVDRAFRALGYEFEWIHRHSEEDDKEQEFRKRITRSIDKGRPVLVEGVVGPPEVGIATGYEKDGDVLIGRSYFHDRTEEYYRKADWYKDCWSVGVIGHKIERPGERDVLRGALEWAVKLARAGTWGPDRACGLAAYDAWAAALLIDADFPPDDLEKLNFRCVVNTNVNASGLRESRDCAARFLRSMKGAAGDASTQLEAAAVLYNEEVGILDRMLKVAPSDANFSPEDRRLEMADRGLRERMAKMVIEAKDKDEEAVEKLESALDSL